MGVAGTGKVSGESSKLDTTTTKVVFPSIHMPYLVPGFVLSSSIAEMETCAQCATSNQSWETSLPSSSQSYSTLSHSTMVEAALEPFVADLMHRRRKRPKKALSDDTSVTASDLNELFHDPSRVEMDIYRPVDVARCRRELDTLKLKLPDMLSDAGSTQGTRSSFLSKCRSCLTTGQKRCYFSAALQWVRAQPLRHAPPNAVEVLSVIKREQTLFLGVLRELTRTHCTASFEFLGGPLKHFSQYHRIQEVRGRLYTFLDEAKSRRHLIICAVDESIETVAPAVTNGGAEETQTDLQATTDARRKPLKLSAFYTSGIRLLSVHMRRLYSWGAAAVPSELFPGSQVQAVMAASCAAILCPPSGVIVSPIDASTSTLDAQGEAARNVVLAATVALQRLPLQRLPTGVSPSSEEEGDREGPLLASSDSGGGTGGAARFAMDHSESDAPLLSPAMLRRHVNALRRFLSFTPFGTKNEGVASVAEPEEEKESDSEAAVEADAIHDAADQIAGVSLSIDAGALLKMVSSHVNAEEERSSYRIPVRAHLIPEVPSNAAHSASQYVGSGGSFPEAPRYKVRVVVGESIPNVKESRQSIQAAAAAWLLRSSTTGEVQNIPPLPASIPLRAAVQIQRSRPVGKPKDLVSDSALPDLSTWTPAAAAAVATATKESLPTASTGADADATAKMQLSFNVCTRAAEWDSGESTIPVFFLVKMEHLNDRPVNVTMRMRRFQTATHCPYLLELFSPLEMLQLDWWFLLFPKAIVKVHRVQWKGGCSCCCDTQLSGDESSSAADGAGSNTAEGDDYMNVLAVETLTRGDWLAYRQEILERPEETLTTCVAGALLSPLSVTPRRVLGTRQVDLLYDTISWLLDTVVDRVRLALKRDTLRTSVPSGAVEDEEETVSSDRFMYFILRNRVNFYNCTGKSVLTHSSSPTRGILHYVLDDASDVYSHYRVPVPVEVEVRTLNFVERASESEEVDASHPEDPAEGESGAIHRVTTVDRLYRDPQTWNTEGIPFMFSGLS